MHDVMKADGMLGDSQPDSTGFSQSSAVPGFGRIDSAAFAGVDGLTMFGLGPVALSLQIRFAAETKIGLALGDQALGMFAVNLQTLGLAIGRVRSAQVGSFVPIETQPFEVGDKLILKAGFTAFDVCVFYAQHHGAALLSGEKPVEQRGTRITNVEMPGGTGCISYGDSRSHQRVLADKAAHIGARRP